MLPCALFIPLTVTSCTHSVVKHGRQYFDTHAYYYSWSCEKLDFKFSTLPFRIDTPRFAEGNENQAQSFSVTPLEISSSSFYFDIFLSEESDIETKINYWTSQQWKSQWEPFFDRSIIFWKYTEYYDAFFCYKFSIVTESIDDTINVGGGRYFTNWTLKTLLTDSDIHFFQKKDIPDEVSQQYQTFKEFFLANNELTFESYSTIEDEIPLNERIKYFDERKKISRYRILLNS
ncbi:MAG: hypothetical protein LBV22_01495 [Mycoplasmataceae bacterium]|nr:hypothetical protein [Mycoplasmataceae bacterium]